MNLIPYTKGFHADAEGNIYDADGNLRTQYTNGDGYKTTSVLMEDGDWVTFGTHRLVALAFHKPVIDHLLLTVNHLDGVITNNKPGNLEWVTAQNNIIHGILLNRFTNRPLILGTKGEKEFYFNDLYEISHHLKTDIDTVWKHIREATPFNGWTIRHLKSSDTRVGIKITAKPRHISERIRKLVMLDLITKEETKFPSIKAAAKHFGVGITNIRHRISTPGFPKVFKGRYVFVDKGESFDFVTESMVTNTQKTAAKKIVAYNIERNEFEEFDSATKFLKQYRELSKKAVTVRLKNGRLNETGGWIVKVVTDLQQDKEAILRWLDLYYSRLN